MCLLIVLCMYYVHIYSLTCKYYNVFTVFMNACVMCVYECNINKCIVQILIFFLSIILTKVCTHSVNCQCILMKYLHTTDMKLHDS